MQGAVPGYENLAFFVINEAQRVVSTRTDVIPTKYEMIKDSSVTGGHVYSDMYLLYTAAGLHILPGLQIVCVSHD